MNHQINSEIESLRDNIKLLHRISEKIFYFEQILHSTHQLDLISAEFTREYSTKMLTAIYEGVKYSEGAKQLIISLSKFSNLGGEAVLEALNKIEAMLNQSGKIRDIVNIINDAEFQANLMVLNATISAAGSTEVGIKSISSSIATEIAYLAKCTSSSVIEVQLLIEESLEKIEAGRILVDEITSMKLNVMAVVKDAITAINEFARVSESLCRTIVKLNLNVNVDDDSLKKLR